MRDLRELTCVGSNGVFRYRFATTTGQAQVIVDVSKITCDQFVHPKITTPNLIAARLSGCYNAKRNNKIVDLEILEAM